MRSGSHAGRSRALPLPALLFSGLESRVYDTLVRSSPTRPPSGRIVIVDVDERSLSAIGQWPWRRDLIGRLIGQLRDLGASTIALDIVFAEADRYEGTELVPDAVLADALRRGPCGPGLRLDIRRHRGSVNRMSAAPARPCHRSTRRPGGRRSLLSSHWRRVQPADPDARQPALPGFLNAAPDPDGILRRVPLLMEFGGRVYPGLALAAVAAATRHAAT